VVSNPRPRATDVTMYIRGIVILCLCCEEWAGTGTSHRKGCGGKWKAPGSVFHHRQWLISSGTHVDGNLAQAQCLNYMT
jgi:hypothetical protein